MEAQPHKCISEVQNESQKDEASGPKGVGSKGKQRQLNSSCISEDSSRLSKCFEGKRF